MEEMIRYRRAEKRDAQAIRALIWRVSINPMGLNWQRFLLAVDEEDHLLGCGQIKPHGDGTREIASIAVQPEWQNRGIGQAIIQRLLVENSLPLYLTCRSEMEPYYQKFGFRTLNAGEMPPYFHRIYGLASALSRLWPRFGQMRVMMKNA